MSDQLSLLPYPKIDPKGELETNPLLKYQRQLNPLASLTSRNEARRPTSPVQDPVAAMHLAAMGAQGMTPSPVGAPPSPGALPPPPPTATPLAGSEPPPAPPSGSTMLRGATPGAGPGAASPVPDLAPSGGVAGGPHDVTQYEPDPTSGGLVRQRGAVARRLAAQTMGGPTFGKGSQALAGLAPEEAQGAMAPPSGPATQGAPLSEDAPEQSQSQNRISTRIPSEPAQKKAGIDAHTTADLSSDYDSMKRAPEAFDKNAKLIKDLYPGFAHLKTDDPAKITEAFVQHAKENLKWIYGKMNDEKGPIGPSIVERAKRWYSGANKIAHDLAKEFKVQPYQAAAVLAALSPQKDWYQNVHLARRVFEAHQLGHNWTMTPEMQKYSDKYIASLAKPKKGEEEMSNPERIAELRALQEKFKSTPMAQLTDPHERAVFARWHDEAHNPRDYRTVTPEGEMAGTYMIPAKYFTSGKRKGELKEAARPRSVSWGSFNEIAKGMAALQGASLPEVSRLMGGNHKVRNFFNNIIAPLHGHDVTIDTHAIAAALLRPLGGGAMEVGHGLGTSAGKGVPGAANAATIGNRGMYGLYAEAYRRAAKELKISPRELQSVTWEGIRGLFSPEDKRNKAFVDHVDNVWRNTKMTRDEKREAIANHAGGFKLPSWAGGVDYGDDAED